MDSKVQSWLDATLERSELQWDYLQAGELDDTFGWGAIFQARLQVDSDVSGCGLLLTGPQGCGRHAAAGHMMKLLFAEGYDSVFLDGLDLGSVDFETARGRLDALFDRFYEQGKGLCICLEEMEDCPHRRQLLTYLGQTLYKCLIYRQELTPVFLILIDDRTDQPQILRDRLRLCRMSIPDLSRRTAFLERKARLLKHSVSLQVFAEATEGASYGQLLDMIANVEGLVDSEGGVAVADEPLRAFLKTQLPPATEQETMKLLAQEAQKLVEQLPKMLKDAASAVRVGTVVGPVTEPDHASQQDSLTGNPADARRKIEEMKVSQLATELFGEEGVNEIMAAYEEHQYQ